MAVQLETNTKRFRGLSTDIKPGGNPDAVGELLQEPPVGSIFVETDTGDRYVWRGSWPWIRQEQAIEPALETLSDLGTQILAMLSAIKRGHEAYLWENEVEL